MNLLLSIHFPLHLLRQLNQSDMAGSLAAFGELAQALEDAPIDLRLAFLQKPALHSELDTHLFNEVYGFRQHNWIHHFGFQKEGEEWRQMSDSFLCKHQVDQGSGYCRQADQPFAGSDDIVILYDSQGIIAVNSLYYFNLHNLAHLRSSHLCSLGAEWVTQKTASGWRRVMYATNLIASRTHPVRHHWGVT